MIKRTRDGGRKAQAKAESRNKKVRPVAAVYSIV
jgi:hypothetical protein